MPYNGSGTFAVYTPGTPYVTGTTISSTVANNVNNDFATGLSTAITKNGQTTTTSLIPFAAGISSTTLNVSGATTLAQTAATAISPLLINGWANLGGAYLAASYWKDSMGVVHLQGTIKSGTTTPGTVLFTLPAGFRPTASLIYPVAVPAGVCGSLNITSAGVVSTIDGVSATYTSLDGITFNTV